MTYFNIKLSRDDLTALSQFKPELKRILYEYNNKYNIYVHKLGELFGLLQYLSNNDYSDNINKIIMLKNLLNDYFFEDSTNNFISEYFITDNYEYTRFISIIDDLDEFIIGISDSTVDDFFTLFEIQIYFQTQLENLKVFRMTE